MSKQRVLITGGAGFIGCNAAHYFLAQGWEVIIWDNLSRRGGERNLEWLRQTGPFEFHQVDLRHAPQVDAVYAGRRFNLVLHCAGQVAVTTSIVNPRDDFESNALGTVNLLEAVRRQDPDALLIYTSTNKVYGGMETVPVLERNGRYEYADLPWGVNEASPLDFHSPYGCSKGAADQYVRDYARIYGLATVAFRQSCIYGYRQFGIEDQGWVAWFIIAQVLGKPITVYGDGKQTRDVLFIDDLVQAYVRAYDRRDRVAGQIFNLGGGPKNQLSLLELIEQLRVISGRPVAHSFADWRAGDQKVFVADIRKAKEVLDWEPQNPVPQGLAKLIRWVETNQGLFTD
jgi:CDP-paratose 2-epimerase